MEEDVNTSLRVFTDEGGEEYARVQLDGIGSWSYAMSCLDDLRACKELKLCNLSDSSYSYQEKLQWLRKNRVLNAFFKNMKALTHNARKDGMSHVNNAKENLISGSFCWDSTDEGYNFWNRVDENYRKWWGAKKRVVANGG